MRIYRSQRGPSRPLLPLVLLLLLLLLGAGEAAGEQSTAAGGSSGAGWAGGESAVPAVGLVQWEVDRRALSSAARLEAGLRAELERLVAGRREGEPLLLILPEYTNAFYAVLPLLEEEPEEEPTSWKEVLALHARERGGEGLPDYLRRRAPAVRRWMDAFYGTFAAEHRLWLLAGSYFAVQEGELRNRAVLYGPSGAAIYEQDKVYLTPFERQELSLSPGRRAAARIFRVAGLRCALTICRDSFFSAWEEQLAGAELWIDLKANGAPWSEQTRRLFTRALPERIARGGVPWGVTVTLTGRLFGLLWEGPSSLVHFEPDAPQGWIVLWEARKLRSGTRTLLRLPRNPGEAGQKDQPPRW